MTDFDLVVIGGGIVGLSTAMQALARVPGLSVAVLEKDAALATHQTGRNSGVIHAGVYYAPGSLKSQFCREGAVATMAFCTEHAIPFEQCGKMLVATEPDEIPRMNALYERAVANGLTMERLDEAELSRREPHIRGLAALFVPSTGIVDYGLVALAMAEVIRDRGGVIMTSTGVTHIHETPTEVVVQAGSRQIRTKQLIACAALQSDRIARMCGVRPDVRIVPFRGEYYQLGPDKNTIVNHLIYPIPDPDLPFLGVHLTKMIDGSVTVGPNAVLAFAREGYRFNTVNALDLKEMIEFSGFRKVIRANLKSGLVEMANSLSKSRYLALCQRYCPELKLSDLQPHRSGVRAQAVLADGTLVHDFLIGETARTIHVLNAPSPAATSAIPIGNYILGIAEKQGVLRPVAA